MRVLSMYAAQQQQKWKEPEDDAVDLVTTKDDGEVKPRTIRLGIRYYIIIIYCS